MSSRGGSGSASSGGSPTGSTGAEDALKRIRGIGPLNERKLNEVGVTRFAQIAAWTPEEQREMGERLSFGGRIEREDWVEQARTLAEGGETEFSRRVRAGRVRTSLDADDIDRQG